MGCDLIAFHLTGNADVSIHAPAWGATDLAARVLVELQEFQSTHPHGVRRSYINDIISDRLFQSTHPHGVRPGRFNS